MVGWLGTSTTWVLRYVCASSDAGCQGRSIEAIGEPQGCCAGPGRALLRAAPDDDEPCGTRSVHASEDLDGVHDTLLGHQAAEQAEHDLVVVE